MPAPPTTPVAATRASPTASSIAPPGADLRSIFEQQRIARHLQRHGVIPLAMLVVLGQLFERAHAVRIARPRPVRSDHGQRGVLAARGAFRSPAMSHSVRNSSRRAAPSPPRGGTGAALPRGAPPAAASAPGRSSPRRAAASASSGERKANGTMAVRQASERMSMALWWKMGTSRKACLGAQIFEVASRESFRPADRPAAPRPESGFPGPPAGSFPGAASTSGARRTAGPGAPCGRTDGRARAMRKRVSSSGWS